MTTSKSDTVLVTGGHGFFGSHIVDLLLEWGHRVSCLLRPERSDAVFGGKPVEVRRADLRSARGLDAAVADVDVIYHVAGLVAARGPGEFREVNVFGTRRLAEACARSNPRCRRFLYVSSQAAAGPSPDGRPITEEQAPRPMTHYGRSKLQGERVLPRALNGVPYTIVRPPAMYGPRDVALLPFFRLAAWGLAPGLDGRGRRFNLLHARDAAEGVLAAAGSGAEGLTFFVADATGCSYRDIARALEGAFGRTARRLPFPDALLNLAGVLADEIAALRGRSAIFGRQKAAELRARWWLCSAQRAVRDLGWRPTISLQEGMADTARWYMETGHIPRLGPRG